MPRVSFPVRWSFFSTISTSVPGFISRRFFAAIWYNPFCPGAAHVIRTHLKNVFWPNIFVGASL
jgi:hypothetical protein